MVPVLKDSALILIIVGCCCAFGLLAVVFACILLVRRKNCHAACYNDLEHCYDPPLVEKKIDGGELLFVFDTTVERQQSLSGYPGRSYPSSPGCKYNDNLLRRSVSNIDMIQPKLHDPGTNIDTSKLDLKMYQDEVEAAISPFYGNIGKLLLSVSYDKDSEMLIVTVHRGENIRSKNNNSSISPYLKVCLLPDKKRRIHSKTRKGDCPVFEEEFLFSVPKYDLQSRILRIAVCDFDRFSRQTVLGYVMVALSEVTESLLECETGTEIWKELSDNDCPPGLNKGELLFSISYLPTACRMTITIIQAKDLLIKTEKDFGISVKVNLILNGKVIKSKKTTTNKTDLDVPVFNEPFMFELSNKLLGRISLVLIVYVHNNAGKRIIGKANTGPYMYSTGTGLAQWNDMLLQPRRTFAHWHKLM